MAISLEEAIAIANHIRGTNGQYSFPPDRSLQDLAEAMQALKVGLQRYRKQVTEFVGVMKDIEEGK